MIQFDGFSDTQLGRFREFRRTSYAVLSEADRRGDRTRSTRAAMKAYRREGVDRYFRLPVALFGDRTRSTSV